MENNEFEELRELVEKRELKALKMRLGEMNEVDIAEFLETLPAAQLAVVFRLLPKELAAETFANLGSDEQEYIINSITDKEIAYIMDELFVDDAVDMMEELPANVVKRVMANANSETRALINQFLKYPDNSAGSIMTAEYVDLKRSMNVREAFEHIRKTGEDKETIYTCYVVDSDRKLLGVVTVKELLLADYDDNITDIMEDNVISVTTTDDQEHVSEICSKYDLITVPVVDLENRLVGIITVDDILDVIEQEATEDFEKMAAMTPSDKPYLKTGVLTLAKNRVLWLLLLMISATVTGNILMKFEEAFAVVPLLVALMPMLTDTGGNAGSQSSTMIIRGMAVGDIQPKDILKVLFKEVRVALIVGAVLAVANFIRVVLMYDDAVMVALVVSISLFLTVIIAKSIGCTLPILAKLCRLDPAIMASPIITTLVDCCALTVYFSIAVHLLDI